MAPKNLILLFCSTVALSLVILIIFFSLFFKNVDLSFNTRLPDSAPNVSLQSEELSVPVEPSKADGVAHATINVPPEVKPPEDDRTKYEEILDPSTSPASTFSDNVRTMTDDVILYKPQKPLEKSSSASPERTGLPVKQKKQVKEEKQNSVLATPKSVVSAKVVQTPEKTHSFSGPPVPIASSRSLQTIQSKVLTGPPVPGQ